jgi:hypothetical protein
MAMAVTNDFTKSQLDLNGQITLSQATAIVWGPDGRLYVTEVDGEVKILDVTFGDPDPGDGDPTAQFYVTAAEQVDLVKDIPNYNDDDGGEATGNKSQIRQVTGIDVTPLLDAAGNPILVNGAPGVVMYVTSSDSRIGAGGSGNDANLDTNSGTITRLVQTETGWDAVDIVRGLARSEENHATNGLEVIQEVVEGVLAERIIVASGGNANTGAPSNNFAGQQEQPTSAAILEIDLTEILGMEVKTDAQSGRQYVYDLPTLDDPTRMGPDDNNDPFGGNDGFNSAKLIADGPVQIYSAGYRNAYDVEVTEDGRVWTYDNGANNNWGGRPAGEDQDGDTNSTEAETLAVNNGLPAGFVATNLFVEDNSEIFGNFNPQNWDQLHEVTRSDDLNGRSLSAGQGGATVYSWDHPDFDDPLTLVYGGHPNPTRAEGARAGLLYSPQNGTGGAKLLVSNEDNGGISDFLEVVEWLSTVGYSDQFIADTVVAVEPGVTYADQFVSDYVLPTIPGVYSLVEDPSGPIGLPSDIDEIVHQVNAIEGNYLEAGYTDGAVDTRKGSVNGLAEYTSTIFDDGTVKMSGALFASGFDGTYYVIGRNDDGVVETTTASNRTIAADRAVIDATGGPLGLAAIGDDLVPHGGSAAFRGTVWAATYNFDTFSSGVEILQPGNPDTNPLLPSYAGQIPSDPLDADLDGVDHFSDPFDRDAANGYAVAAGESLVLNFSKVDPRPELQGTIANTGLSGAMLDGVTPNQDAFTGSFDQNGDGIPDAGAGDGFALEDQRPGLYDEAGNIIPGANAPILQIKSVRDGSALGTDNDLRDGLQTGIRLAPDVKRMVAETEIFNWYVDQPGDGRISGLTFGDGTQSNFVRVVFGDIGGQLGLEVGIEVDDVYTVLGTSTDTAFVTALTNATDSPGPLNQKKVALQIEVSDIGGGYVLAARYKVVGEAEFEEIALSDATLPAGVLRDVLDGTHTVSDQDGTTAPSGAAIGIVAEKDDGALFTAVDFDVIRVDAFGNEIAASNAAAVQAATGTPETDTIIYDGTETELGALQPAVENFDGSGSSADFNVAGNALDNVIKVGSGANTVTTGAGADVVRGGLGDLAGDTVTDFSRDDTLLIEGLAEDDITSLEFEDGSAVIVINGARITLDGEDFTPENFDASDGASYFDFTDTVDGLEITSRAPLSPVVAINAGGTGGQAFTGTLRDTELTFIGDGGGNSPGAGFGTTGANKAYTNGQAQGLDFPDTDLDAILASERSNANDFGYTVSLPNGTYLVDLIFAEIFHNVAGGGGAGISGNRTFDVAIEGAEVISNLDVEAEAGGAGLQLVKSIEVEVTDGVLDIDFSQDGPDIDQAKVSGIVVWSTSGGFVPVDATAPVVEGIALENPQNVQDGTRVATVVVTDETGFAEADFAGLTGAALQVGGITPDAVTYAGTVLSNGGKTATVTFEITGEGGAWLNGTVGTLSLAPGVFNDAAGNGSAAASAGFVIQSNLDSQERGAVVRAINIGTTANDAGDLEGEDDNAYGGAIAADSLITDAFGDPVAFEADSNAFHTSPKGTGALNNNVDGQLGSTGSNAAGIDLDGSAYHTYRDSNAGSWSSTFDGFANGTYVVELHFAELFHGDAAGTGGTGARVGDFTVNGVVFGDDYDAFAAGAALNGTAVGADTPSVIRKAVTVTDGTITVDVDTVAGQPGYSAIVVYDAVDPSEPATLSVADVTVAEGEDAQIEITRTGDLSEAVTVDVAIALDGTAAASDVGAPSAMQVTFAAGEMLETVTLPIVDDEDEEGAETLSVTLSNPTGGAVIGDGAATVTIAASDSDLAVEVGATIFELDFEAVEGEALAVGGFDGALGSSAAVIDEATSQVTGGKLVVQTSEGDINDGADNGSDNDFTKEIDLSDPALTEIYLTTRFDNPFDEALLISQGITNGVVPNFVQQGIVLGDGTQVAGEMVKLVWGGVAGTTGVQMWTKGNATTGLSQAATLPQMVGTGVTLFDVASVELTLVVDKAAGTLGQNVTLYDVAGNVLGGTRIVDTPGFFTMPPVTPPADNDVLADIADPAVPTHVGVHSSDNSSPEGAFGSFEATWDFLRLSSPQFVDGPAGSAPDSVDGTPVSGDDFSDDHLAPTALGVLPEGETSIVATQAGDGAPGGRERDYFTFEVAEGQQLTGIVIKGYEGGEGSSLSQGFMAIAQGAQVPLSQAEFEAEFGSETGLLGGYIYNAGDVQNPLTAQDGNVLDELGDGEEGGFGFVGFTAPLPAGVYTIWLNQGSSNPSTVTLDLVTAAVPGEAIVIAIADADPVLEGSGDDLAFALTATKDFTGEIEVSFDLGGTPSVQTVVFTSGGGILTVPAPDDDVDDGDTTVSVTLTGAMSADATGGVSIDPAAAVADGVINEDDTVEPNLVRGDFVFGVNAGARTTPVTDESGNTFDVPVAAEWTINGQSGTPAGNGIDYTGDGQDDEDDTVYETEYWGGSGSSQLVFTRGGIPAGEYIVVIKLAEIFAGADSVGARVFDISINGTVVPALDNLDLFATVGANTALDIDVPVTIPDEGDGTGTLMIEGLPSTDNAKFSAIALFEAVEFDPTAVAVSVADVTVSEEAGTAEIVFTREGNTDTDMTITFSTADGTATDGADYVGIAGGTVTIPAGATSAAAAVTLLGDATEEGSEAFTVTIDAAVAAGAAVTIADASATVTLTDDDGADPLDIDGDGTLNEDDPFAYDGQNGMDRVLGEGVTFRQDFGTDTTDPFSAEAGFTGVLINPLATNIASTEADPYGNRTTEGGAFVEGGAFKVTSSETDVFGNATANATNNNVADNYLSAADVSGVDGFSVEGKIQGGWLGGTPGSFASFGITLGAGGTDDYVKFVLGGFNDDVRLQIAHENSLTGGKEQNLLLGDGTDTGQIDVDFNAVASVVFAIDVDKTTASATSVGTLVATATFLDASGGELGTGGFTREIAPAGSFATAMAGENPLTGGTGGVAYGVSITDWGGAGSFQGEWDYLEIKGPEPVNDAPTAVTLTPATLSLAEDVDASAGSVKLADIVVADDGLGTNDITLTGADASLFAVVDGAAGPELHLAQGSVLDVEAAASLDVIVEVDDAAVGGAPDTTAAFTLTVTDVNEAPTLTVTPVVVTLAEDVDTSAAITVATIAVTDDAIGANDLSLIGADAALFEIATLSADTLLQLKAGTALDFETAASLDVSVVLDDAGIGAGAEATVAVPLAVTDVNEAPTVTVTPIVTSLVEDADTSAAIAIATITVTDDALGTNDLSLAGADAASFEIVEDGTSTQLVLAAGAVLDFDAAPFFDVSVVVDDAGIGIGAEATVPVTLNVTEAADPPPTVAAEIADKAATEDAAFGFTLPDGTFADDGGETALALSATLEDDTPLPDWLQFDPVTRSFSGTPSQADVDGGALSVKVTATDAAGGSVSDVFALDLTEVNDPPVAVDDAGTAFSGFTATFTNAQLLANDTDEEGGTLTVNSVGNPVNGTVTFDGVEAVFTPLAGFTGTASFDYVVTDNGGVTDTGTVTIAVESGDPVSVTDIALAAGTLGSYGTQDVEPASAVVSGDGTALAITGNSWKALTLDAPIDVVAGMKLRFDFASDDLAEVHAIGLDTNTNLNNPSRAGTNQVFFGVAGSQLEKQGGAFVTELAEDLYETGDGTRTFEVDLSAYAGQSYVNVIFVNDADQQTGNGTFSNLQIVQPVALNSSPDALDDAFSVRPDGTLTLTAAALLANDGDPDGDALTIASVGNAIGGTVQITPEGLVAFTPAPGVTGTASFDYTVSDGKGGQDTATVTVTINGGPALDVVTDVVISEAALSSYAFNQDKDPADFSVSDDGTGLTLTGNTWKVLDMPGDGYAVTSNTVLRFEFTSTDLAEIHAIGLDINTNLNGKAGSTGEQVFFGLSGSQVDRADGDFLNEVLSPVYETTDGVRAFQIDLGAYAGQTFDNLVFVNDADKEGGNGTFTNVRFVEPTATGNEDPVAVDDVQRVEENAVLTILPETLLANDGDVDGDTLTIASVSAPVGGTVALDAAGRVVFTPTPDTFGPASFDYTVSDGKGGVSTATVAVDVFEEGSGNVVTEIDFSQVTIGSYGGQDARPGTGAAIGAGGASLELSGNVWKTVALDDYVITESSKLFLDLTIDQLGELHAIGFDNNNDAFDGDGVFFQFFGTQSLLAADQSFRDVYSTLGETVSYEIDLSAFAGQSFDRLVFINDHDFAPQNALSTFSNVSLVEGLTSGGGPGQAPFIATPSGVIGDLVLTEDAPFEQNLPILDDDSTFTLAFQGLPDFVSVDGTFLSGTAEGGDVGIYTVTVTATDPDLNTISDTFDIVVGNVNDVPEAAAPTLPEAAGVLGSELSIQLPFDFFTDEDGDALTYSLIGASAGLTIDPVTGTINGAPDIAGDVVLTVRATDAAETFAEATLTLSVSDGPPREGVLIEAENFTGLAASEFEVEVSGGASNDRLIRMGPDTTAEVATDLTAAGAVPGFYDLSITYYDEIDGTATLTVLIDNADGAGPVEVGFQAFDRTDLPGQGGSLQLGNIQVLTIPGIEVKAGATLVLRGVSDTGERTRIDKVELEPVSNVAPVLPADAAVATDENATDVGTIAATDPEGRDIAYAIAGGADAALFAIDAATGALSFQAAPDFEMPGDEGADNVYDVIVSASDGALISTQTLAVTVGDVNEAPVGTAPATQQVTQGEAVALPTLTSFFADPDGGDMLTYAVDQLPAGVTVAADGITLEGNPTTIGTTTVTVTATDAAGLADTVTFDVTVAEPGAFDPADYAPDGDLDGDGTVNADDDDVDGDGVANVDDPFAYDAADGMTVAAGQTRSYDFDLEGTVFENGMTGFLQGTNAPGFVEDTGAASVAGGAMVVDPVTGGDTGGSNNPQDDVVVGVKNGTFTATASVVNPWAGTNPNPNSFDQLGLVLGLDSADMIKLVFGQSGGVVEFQKQEGDTATKFGGGSPNANIPFPAGITSDNFATAEITFEVTSTDAAAASIAGTIRFLDAAGAEIGALGPVDAPIGGALAAALADAGTGVAVGFTHVNGGGAPSFVAELDSLEITAPNDGTGGPGEETVVYRINAGGQTIAAIDVGPAWLGDSIASPNPLLTVTDNRADLGGSAVSTFDGVPDGVFAEARSSDAAFSYDIPVELLGGGENYEVRLYFAEIFPGAQAGGFRDFDATLEGFPTAAFNDIDPGELFGAEAGVLTAQVKVTDGELNIGFVQDVAQNPIINGIEIVAIDTDVENPVDPTSALEALAAQDDLKTDAEYTDGEIGSAVLTILAGQNEIDQSNFGGSSFQVTNVGGKNISAIFVDVTTALYPDSVFDPDGQGGDNVAKPWQIDSDGDTGAYVDGMGYFLPGPDPIPNSAGSGGPSNGGFRGAMVKFDADQDGGFGTGETVGFSGDMDPNSIAGMSKGDVDGGAILGWDVGGVSGHELIGSAFTVLFDDGTTATGELASDGSTAGAHALAVEGGPAASAPGLAVGTVLPGQTGTYGGTRPTVTVTGDPGDRVQITLSKGFNPVTQASNGIAGLVKERLERYDFEASNAFDAQTVIVTIGSDGTFDATTLFDYDDAPGNDVGSGTFPGDDVADIAFVATKVAATGASPLPISATTAPIYLTNDGGPATGDPTGGTGGADGYFAAVNAGSANAYFKIQIEDANGTGGTDPGGKWDYVTSEDELGNQDGFQGSGYYVFGSEVSRAIDNANGGNEMLEYTIFVDEDDVGLWNIEFRVSRDGNRQDPNPNDDTPADGTFASDQQNDLWLSFKSADESGAGEIEGFLSGVGSNEPEQAVGGFVKVFGGPQNGNWGETDNVDGEPNDFDAQVEIAEAGLYTVQIDGRSQGYHIDYFELYKGSDPGNGAENSIFVEGEPMIGGGNGGAAAGDLVIPIDASADDWEQFGGGGSADFEIGDNGGPQWAALRFDDIEIPEGASIQSAFIRFQADGNWTAPATFTISIEDDENAAGYSGTDLAIDRTYADEFQWTPTTWTDGQTYDTPDLSALVDNVVGTDGISDGALGFLFEGTGKRAAVAFDGTGAAPELHITYADEAI